MCVTSNIIISDVISADYVVLSIIKNLIKHIRSLINEKAWQKMLSSTGSRVYFGRNNLKFTRIQKTELAARWLTRLLEESGDEGCGREEARLTNREDRQDVWMWDSDGWLEQRLPLSTSHLLVSLRRCRLAKVDNRTTVTRDSVQHRTHRIVKDAEWGLKRED